MKKLLTIVLAVALVFFASNAMAAGTVSEGSATTYYNAATGKPAVIEVTFTCTADAGDGTYPATAMSAALTAKVKGWVLDEVRIDGNHAGTEPTEDSDLYLYRSYNTSPGDFDVLGGNGVDQVDNTASRVVVPASAGQNKWAYVSTPLTLYIVQAAVVTNSAVVYVTLVFVNPYAN